ncbi:MAG: hypothetical protein IH977_05055 [Nitrospinae bacterium]|nr:hypothetical protein [Nitrospinota bacterium]
MVVAFLSLGVILVLGVLFLFFVPREPSLNKETRETFVGCPAHFNPTQFYVDKDGGEGIGFSEGQKSICLVKPDTSNTKVLPIKDLLLSEVLENGTVVAKSSRSDDKGKELLAKIHTFNAKASSEQDPEQATSSENGNSSGNTNSIELRILVNDDDPVHVVSFLNMESKKGGLIYNVAATQAKIWQDIMNSLIKKAGQE